MKLCLGTAQFGLDYGINNSNGKILRGKIPEILIFAHDNGINMVDTASAYGDSEYALGESIPETGKSFNIITKFPSNTDIRPFKYIDTSLNLLKTKKVFGYLFHNYAVFKENPDYIEDFVKIKHSGKCEKIGFSLYYPSEAEFILENNIPCDIVQIPYNIFDQRFFYLFEDLQKKKIDIYIRSVFLQGIFFIEPERLGVHFDSIKEALKEFNQLAKDKNINISTFCMHFIKASLNEGCIVLGIDSLSNLKENIFNCEILKNVNIPYQYFKKYAVYDENIILPFNWKK